MKKAIDLFQDKKEGGFEVGRSEAEKGKGEGERAERG